MECTQVLFDPYEDTGNGYKEPKVEATLEVNGVLHNIMTGENVIGRDSALSSIVLKFQPISAEHARIEAGPGGHTICDLRSRNKTRHNGKILKPNIQYWLENGDTIFFADIKATYHISTAQEKKADESTADDLLVPETPAKPLKEVINSSLIVPESPGISDQSSSDESIVASSQPPRSTSQRLQTNSNNISIPDDSIVASSQPPQSTSQRLQTNSASTSKIDIVSNEGTPGSRSVNSEKPLQDSSLHSLTTENANDSQASLRLALSESLVTNESLSRSLDIREEDSSVPKECTPGTSKSSENAPNLSVDTSEVHGTKSAEKVVIEETIEDDKEEKRVNFTAGNVIEDSDSEENDKDKSIYDAETQILTVAEKPAKRQVTFQKKVGDSEECEENSIYDAETQLIIETPERSAKKKVSFRAETEEHTDKEENEDSIYDAETQLFTETPESSVKKKMSFRPESKEDSEEHENGIYDAETQVIPMESSDKSVRRRVAFRTGNSSQEDSSVYKAETQILLPEMPVKRKCSLRSSRLQENKADQQSESSIYDAETQILNEDAEKRGEKDETSIYDAETQLPDTESSESLEDANKNIYDAETQLLSSEKGDRESLENDENIYEAETQLLSFNKTVKTDDSSESQEENYKIEKTEEKENSEEFVEQTSPASKKPTEQSGISALPGDGRKAVVSEKKVLTASSSSKKPNAVEGEPQDADVITSSGTSFYSAKETPDAELKSCGETSVSSGSSSKISSAEETLKTTEVKSDSKRKMGEKDDDSDSDKTDPEDFFTCPTQKLPDSKQQEKQSNEAHPGRSVDGNMFDRPTEVLRPHEKIALPGIESPPVNEESDSEDIFNCATQKINFSSDGGSDNENESDKRQKKKNHSEKKEKDDDDDIFNCATQKIKRNEKVDDDVSKDDISKCATELLSDKENEPMKEKGKRKNNRKVNSRRIDDDSDDSDDIFNRPTQKISRPKNDTTNPTPNKSSTSRKKKTSPVKPVSDSDDTDGEDIFNCPTQKLMPRRFEDDSDTGSFGSPQKDQLLPKKGKGKNVSRNLERDKIMSKSVEEEDDDDLTDPEDVIEPVSPQKSPRHKSAVHAVSDSDESDNKNPTQIASPSDEQNVTEVTKDKISPGRINTGNLQMHNDIVASQSIFNGEDEESSDPYDINDNAASPQRNVDLKNDGIESEDSNQSESLFKKEDKDNSGFSDVSVSPTDLQPSEDLNTLAPSNTDDIQETSAASDANEKKYLSDNTAEKSKNLIRLEGNVKEISTLQQGKEVAAPTERTTKMEDSEGPDTSKKEKSKPEAGLDAETQSLPRGTLPEKEEPTPDKTKPTDNVSSTNAPKTEDDIFNTERQLLPRGTFPEDEDEEKEVSVTLDKINPTDQVSSMKAAKNEDDIFDAETQPLPRGTFPEDEDEERELPVTPDKTKPTDQVSSTNTANAEDDIFDAETQPVPRGTFPEDEEEEEPSIDNTKASVKEVSVTIEIDSDILDAETQPLPRGTFPEDEDEAKEPTREEAEVSAKEETEGPNFKRSRRRRTEEIAVADNSSFAVSSTEICRPKRGRLSTKRPPLEKLEASSSKSKDTKEQNLTTRKNEENVTSKAASDHTVEFKQGSEQVSSLKNTSRETLSSPPPTEEVSDEKQVSDCKSANKSPCKSVKRQSPEAEFLQENEGSDSLMSRIKRRKVREGILPDKSLEKASTSTSRKRRQPEQGQEIRPEEDRTKIPRKKEAGKSKEEKNTTTEVKASDSSAGESSVQATCESKPVEDASGKRRKSSRNKKADINKAKEEPMETADEGTNSVSKSQSASSSRDGGSKEIKTSTTDEGRSDVLNSQSVSSSPDDDARKNETLKTKMSARRSTVMKRVPEETGGDLSDDSATTRRSGRLKKPTWKVRGGSEDGLKKQLGLSYSQDSVDSLDDSLEEPKAAETPKKQVEVKKKRKERPTKRRSRNEQSSDSQSSADTQKDSSQTRTEKTSLHETNSQKDETNEEPAAALASSKSSRKSMGSEKSLRETRSQDERNQEPTAVLAFSKSSRKAAAFEKSLRETSSQKDETNEELTGALAPPKSSKKSTASEKSLRETKSEKEEAASVPSSPRSSRKTSVPRKRGGETPTSKTDLGKDEIKEETLRASRRSKVLEKSVRDIATTSQTDLEKGEKSEETAGILTSRRPSKRVTAVKENPDSEDELPEVKIASTSRKSTNVFKEPTSPISRKTRGSSNEPSFTITSHRETKSTTSKKARVTEPISPSDSNQNASHLETTSEKNTVSKTRRGRPKTSLATTHASQTTKTDTDLKKKIEEPRKVGRARKSIVAEKSLLMNTSTVSVDYVGAIEDSDVSRSSFSSESSCASASTTGRGRKRREISSDSKEPSPVSRTSSSESLASPSRRSLQRKNIKQGHQVLFTGYMNTELENVVKELGGTVVETVETATVAVTDKLRRTVKFLSMLGRGKPIVSPKWLSQSKKSGTFLDPWKFLLTDTEAEKRFAFKMETSLRKALDSKLLDGYTVMVTKNVSPPPEAMKDIINSCGGTMVKKAPSHWPEKSIIISCVEDSSVVKRLKHSPTVVAEWLLSGILQQRLDTKKYKLNL